MTFLLLLALLVVTFGGGALVLLTFFVGLGVIQDDSILGGLALIIGAFALAAGWLMLLNTITNALSQMPGWG